ncbi:MAG TPA: DUF2680 domain-containing protein [Epulopiscium sp.]|nr:DUF2680 domain-containing protein [Candidatus Epulonipiscium sp.]
MKNFKKMNVLGGIILAIGATSVTAFGASVYRMPAETMAGFTATIEENFVVETQDLNETYGTIADQAGMLDKLGKERIELKKDDLNEQVAVGTITKEQADAIIKAIEANQANCKRREANRTDQNKVYYNNLVTKLAIQL